MKKQVLIFLLLFGMLKPVLSQDTLKSRIVFLQGE